MIQNPLKDKWTGPLQPPPFWLHPEMEWLESMDPPKMKRGAFVVACVQTLLDLGCDLDQAFGVAANTMNEAAWGQKYRGWNLGGWKINKRTSTEPNGTPRWWWRALGHKSQGDPHTCFYRVFPSMEAFYREWLANFVPKAGTGRYKKTGQAFWAGEEWFDDLIAAGYKGEVTRAHPRGSIAEHAQIIRTILIIWCQHLLGVNPDGRWGPISRAACQAWQSQHGLEPTGTLTQATLDELLDTHHDNVINIARAGLNSDEDYRTILEDYENPQEFQKTA